MKKMWKPTLWRYGLLASMTAFQFSGCDAQTRAAVENGIITSSSSLLGALFRAIIEVATEEAAASAQLIVDTAGRIVA
jgi:hypothetical protein